MKLDFEFKISFRRIKKGFKFVAKLKARDKTETSQSVILKQGGLCPPYF
ncbi:hypothetical protein [Riemerella anatipestifer]|nr:hypothetical protein [Riemerella anatipestifer]MBT0551599.1 hypothetical protein [Riemerella anatipestifer]MBT0552716.1 hypothetical protein [Riemerella anatipestifer]MCE3023454.1 hypothetical protein [Riemerella anatipestifer]MCU7558961.1 hypothetical protein [Riemerella anatipestifer]MDY3448118.1 hypothetical protein [Riemerella anatipestifer]